MPSLTPNFSSTDPRILRDIQEAPALRLSQELSYGEQSARELFESQSAEVRTQVVDAVGLLQQRVGRLRFYDDGIDAAGLARLQHFLTTVL